MFNTGEVGKQIALLRKEKKYTQEKLADKLGISCQAISKWENGHSLPEVSLLPLLAKTLDCTIDTILIPSRLQILEAKYTDGYRELNVTQRLNRLVQDGNLSLTVCSEMILKVDNDRVWYLLIKYKNTTGVYYAYGKQGSHIHIKEEQEGLNIEKRNLKIIDAYYGNKEAMSNVNDIIKQLKFLNYTKIYVNHETFPSNPSTSDREYLSIIYMNEEGIQIIVCEENQTIEYSSDMKNLNKVSENKKIIKGIEPLDYERRMYCTWAGALTVSLRAMGIDTTYEKIMGVSGACYRVACHSVWDYSWADALVSYDYATPGYKAFGYRHAHAQRVPKEYRDEERSCIVKDIDKGLPVLAINLKVAPQWGVITGYEQKGKKLLCRTYFDKDVIGEKFLEQDRYLPADNWPFIITHFEEKIKTPSDKENFINSLKTMIDSNNSKDNRCGYLQGYDAYKKWINALENSNHFINLIKNDYEQFSRNFDVHCHCIKSLVDARRCAYLYIRESSKLFDNYFDDIINIANVYKSIYNKANTMLKKLPREKKIGKNIAKVWTGNLRLEQAKILKEILTLEKEAEEKATKLLKIIGKEKSERIEE
ncbi:helix-turn-helix transcriptional regulator [Clostridiaceae bacterium M8S5]|nr:helix-turn-helix transcriptional regulator [Clostridiaceae bacterium M8S5]